eukprot:5557228-Amphidinium_carterae.1
MHSKETGVLLVYVWLIATTLGPCLPALLPLVLVLAEVHRFLLFGWFHLLNTEDAEGEVSYTPQSGIRPMLLVVAVLHVGMIGSLDW